MNILVCGGAGFIGANFIWYLNENYPEDKIFCVDLLTYAADINNIKSLIINKKCKFIKADICDAKKMYAIMEKIKPDAVINFAGETHVDKSIINSYDFVKTNVLGVQVLLDCCLKFKVRFHQVSTDEVYGDLPLSSDKKFNEESVLNPSNPYSASKAAADLFIKSYVRTHNVKATITRSTNNFGRFQNGEKFIPFVISRIKNDMPVLVYGDGKNVRSWISVNDNCRAIDCVLRHGKIGDVYNVGTGFEISNIELVEKIARMMHKKAVISFIEDRKGHDLKYSLGTKKIEKELGWKPCFDFDCELDKLIKLY